MQLFRKGPGTTGIFRKSALQRTAKGIRQALDAGTIVLFPILFWAVWERWKTLFLAVMIGHVIVPYLAALAFDGP